MIKILLITAHDRLQTITFTHDTIGVTLNKWDDTISGATCGWTNTEVQSGLVLVPENTRDSTDRIRTKYGQKTKQTSTENRLNTGRRPEETSTENRRKIERHFPRSNFDYCSIIRYCKWSVTNYYIQPQKK